MESRDKRYMHGWFDWLSPHFRGALINIFCSVCVLAHILIRGRRGPVLWLSFIINQVRMQCCGNSLIALTFYVGDLNAITTTGS